MAKDACYRKVKARYKVFPSAYATGETNQKKQKAVQLSFLMEVV